jgi:hypothetical protein
MARKVDEAANFVFVQLIEREPGMYDKSHPDCARQDRIDLVWERISYETTTIVWQDQYYLDRLCGLVVRVSGY